MSKVFLLNGLIKRISLWSFSCLPLLSTSLLFTGCTASKANATTFVVASQSFNYYPHYNFLATEDKGFIWAVLEAYAKESGHSFIYIAMPVARLQLELSKGTVDFIYPDNPTFHSASDELKAKQYSNTIIRTLSGVIVRPDNVNRSLSDIYSISLPLGFTPFPWGDKLISGDLRLVEVPDSLAALQMVQIGRTDGAELDYYVSQYLSMSDPSLGPLTLATNLPHSFTTFHLATVSQYTLLDDIDRFLDEHKDMVEDLKKRYGITEPSQVFTQLETQQSKVE